MLKKMSLLLLVGGIIFIGISSWNIYRNKVIEVESLHRAQHILQHSKKIQSKDNIRFNPKIGQAIGTLSIPSINIEVPIIEGANPNELAKGVGHYQSSAFPTQHNQIVLSGHRDTVFRKFANLKIGDLFIVKLPYGTFIYKSYKTKIVKATDKTIIRSTSPNEELVITTCYPFRYIGDAPDRYIIFAKPYKKK